MKTDWINIHTHVQGEGICVLDLSDKEDVVVPKNNLYFSLGIHPLFMNGNEEYILQEMEKSARQNGIVAIGEAGIDRNSPASVETQKYWFERQCELACRYDLPVIIHVVRAIPEIISIHKKYPSVTFIIHGFNNRKESMQDLLRHGFYVSAGKNMMNEDSNIYKLLPEIPREQLFIETDDSDFTIEEVYKAVAERRGEDVEMVKEYVCDNFQRVFSI